MAEEIIFTIIKGFGFGIVLAFMIGPVFFSLIQTSIYHGFPIGASLALGIFLSDALYAFLALYGISGILDNLNLGSSLGLAGGIVMLIFGFSLMRKTSFLKKVKVVKKHSISRAISKGFLLNGLNPFVMVFWISLIGAIGSDYNYDTHFIIPFILGVLMMVFFTDLLKAYFAAKIKALLSLKVLLIINRITGTIFMGFGAYLIIYVIITGYK